MKVAGIKDCAELLATTRGISKAEAEGIMKDCVEVLATKCAEGGVSFKGVFTIKQKTKKGRSGNMNGHEWKTDDKQTLTISVGSDLDKEMNA